MYKFISRSCQHLPDDLVFIDTNACPGYRILLERDLTELASVAQAGAWKASLLLAGSVLEGLLYCFLKRNEDYIRSVKTKPSFVVNRNGGDINSYKALFEECFPYWGRGFIPNDVRYYRDMIHPASELRVAHVPASQVVVRQALLSVSNVVDAFNRFQY